MYPTEPDTALIIKSYGTNKGTIVEKKVRVNVKDVYLPNYSSIFNENEDKKELYSFKSTLNFFEDLFLISEDLKNHVDKKEKLKEEIMKVNERLPACVYVPFLKSNSSIYFRVFKVL